MEWNAWALRELGQSAKTYYEDACQDLHLGPDTFPEQWIIKGTMKSNAAKGSILRLMDVYCPLILTKEDCKDRLDVLVKHTAMWMLHAYVTQHPPISLKKIRELMACALYISITFETGKSIKPSCLYICTETIYQSIVLLHSPKAFPLRESLLVRISRVLLAEVILNVVHRIPFSEIIGCLFISALHDFRRDAYSVGRNIRHILDIVRNGGG